MSEPQKVFTLRQVVSSVRKTIEERYQQTYWIKAEMYKLNRFPSGHCFPELVQKENGTIVAQISGTLWKHHFDQINERFFRLVKEPLKENTTLLMRIKIGFHELYGLRLQILDIDPNYVLGELQRERLNTLARLKAEELLNRNQKKPFPVLPKRIAVISAASSKGLSDFMEVLQKNEWNYRFITRLFPAYLQGDLAANSIIEQLDQIERFQDKFDVVVIVRGGGGEVGMSCYNNYELCRHICLFPLPVLTGIGHSTNMTIAEMIAFRNAITPTELGEFFVRTFHTFATSLSTSIRSIQVHAKIVIMASKNGLKEASIMLKNMTHQAIAHERFALSEMQRKTKSSSVYSLERMNELFHRLEQQIGTKSQSLLDRHAHQVLRVQEQFPYFLRSFFTRNHHHLDRLEQSVRLMDPVRVLQRGYSITTVEGKIIGPSNPVENGSKIQTRTATFTIESDVVSVENKTNEQEDKLHGSV